MAFCLQILSNLLDSPLPLAKAFIAAVLDLVAGLRDGDGGRGGVLHGAQPHHRRVQRGELQVSHPHHVGHYVGCVGTILDNTGH